MASLKRLKISYVLPDFDEYANSGGLYVIFEHCNGLIRRGHSVRVFNNVGKKPLYLRLDCDVEKHDYDTEMIETDSPDIIVAAYWRNYFFINMMKRIVENNTKLFYLVQGYDKFLVSEEERPFAYKAITGKYKGTIPIHKIAVSRFLQERVKNYFGEDCLYLKNGFEAKEVPPVLGSTDKLRIIARYDKSEYRGWDVVDKVLDRIARQRRDIEIHLFEMKKKIQTSYRSVFHEGFIGDRLLGLFKSCDIYLSGSYSEGFSYPAIEAMSQGACVCATDAGGNREFCIDGDTALLSKTGDADELHKNVLRLTGDPELRLRLKMNGINKAKEFSWDSSVDELERIFESSAAEKYISIPSGPAKTDRCESHAGKRVLLIYMKDPFVEYKDWCRLEEGFKYFKDRGARVESMIFVDKHTGKSVKARLNMLMESSDASSFKASIFYNKNFKLKLHFIDTFLFSALVFFKILLDAYSGKGAYTDIVFAEGKPWCLGPLCRFLNIKLNKLENSLTK